MFRSYAAPGDFSGGTGLFSKLLLFPLLAEFKATLAQLKDKDIITLRVEGTGFAARTEEEALKVSKNDTGGGGGW